MMSGKGVDQKLLIEPDDHELIGDGIDATRVVLRVTDEYDAVRPFANSAIQLSIQGPGEIIGDNPFSLFGGVGDGATSNTVALQAAINAASARAALVGHAVTIQVPPGVYVLTTPNVWSSAASRGVMERSCSG